LNSLFKLLFQTQFIEGVLPRTFEQLITERGAPFEENQSQNYNLGYFNCGLNYHEIKNKLSFLFPF
jgi:hypothetical protein